MTQIIKIQKQVIGTEKVNSVNSRDLYNYLQVKTEFADWIKRAINKYDFVENTDYIITIRKNENSQFSGLKERKDYIVTLDMAKELAMLSNTKKGKETRKYFLACEKRLKVNSSPLMQKDDILAIIEKGLKYDELQEKYIICDTQKSVFNIYAKEFINHIDNISERLQSMQRLKTNLEDTLNNGVERCKQTGFKPVSKHKQTTIQI